MFRPAYCSLYLLCPQEREKLIPLFPFSLQQNPPCQCIPSIINGGRELGVVPIWLRTKLQFCFV